MESVSSYKELARAIAIDSNKIEISGDITKGTVKIVCTGSVTWVIAFGAIGIAYAAIALAPTTAGTSASVSALAAPAAIATVGLPATIAAIAISTAAGSITTLKKLRRYKVESCNDGHAILIRK